MSKAFGGRLLKAELFDLTVCGDKFRWCLWYTVWSGDVLAEYYR